MFLFCFGPSGLVVETVNRALGRARVMTLCREVPGFDLPSDYSGVVFTPFDAAGHWQYDLVKELKAANYGVDANAV